MIFDKFAGIAERQLHQFRKEVNRARLFHFDGELGVMPEDNRKTDAVEFICKNLFLPFKDIAVEAEDSCIFISDREKDAIGPDPIRDFIAVITFPDKDLVMVAKGHCHSFDYADGHYSGISMIDEIWTGPPRGELVFRHEIFNTQDKNYTDTVFAGVTSLVVRALEMLALMNTLERFVLEQKPAKDRPPKKAKGRILRSNERPTYTLVKPKEAREIMGIKEEASVPTGRKITERRAHYRKEHERRLKSDRYSNAKGRVLTIPKTFIPAVWAGESESVVGNKRYKVILDR